MIINLAVNGKVYLIDNNPNTPLLWVLRDSLGLTGTKYSCGIGQCGACGVHLDGVLVKSCTISVSDASESEITIEALSPDGDHPLQRAWIAESVPQCGYCQPGQIMAAAALLARNPHPTDAEIDEVMSDVLCRCGTYQRIRRAIYRVIEGNV
jgi:isoquinoline 1-oxidoreductase alpha subunit